MASCCTSSKILRYGDHDIASVLLVLVLCNRGLMQSHSVIVRKRVVRNRLLRNVFRKACTAKSTSSVTKARPLLLATTSTSYYR